MKKLIQLLVVLCIFVITGCKTNKERYLSITSSGYDKKGNEVVNIYEYSLSTKKVTKSILLLIHLAFILSLIMLYIMLKKIIVAMRLYTYDLDTKKSKKLSGGLTAMNQIIPIENNIYVLGVKRSKITQALSL